jgi:4-hydroxy-3-polyprenylbenzoate decarboxylase
VTEQGTGRLVVGITGASGAIYAARFLARAAEIYETVYVIASEQAAQVAATELDRPIPGGVLTTEALLGEPRENVVFLEKRNYFSPPASGSFRHDGMVIVPCSMGTAGRIAHGISDDLLTRSADVCLKEGRKLVLVVRETPFNLIQLRNLTALAEAGATVLPAAPAFYYKPKTIEELADTIVARILQQLGVEQKVVPQWQFTETE